LQSIQTYLIAFGSTGSYPCDTTHPQFRGFFHQPGLSVRVFDHSHHERELIADLIGIIDSLFDLSLDFQAAKVSEAHGVNSTPAIGYLDAVSRPIAKYVHDVVRLLGGKTK
jgi:hypothetical protein